MRRSSAVLGATLALAGAAAATSASQAHAERVGAFYCIETVIGGAYNDCIGSSKYLVYNYASGVYAVCAGAFYPNENVLYEEYNCGGKHAEQSYIGEHLRPVIHNHGTPNNEVTGLEEYLT